MAERHTEINGEQSHTKTRGVYALTGPITSAQLKPPKQAPAGRVCACGTLLSRYNHDTRCSRCIRTA